MSSAGDSSTNPPNPTPNAPASDAAEAPARESMSLKRGREGSVDLLASETPSIIPIVTKKNRIAEETNENTDDESTPVPVAVEQDDAAEAAAEDTAEPAKETRNVGEVRKKVEEMNWKEGKKDAADVADAADDKVEVEAEAEAEEEGKNANTAAEGPNADKADDGADSDASNAKSAGSDSSLKRKAKDHENGTASEEKKRKSTSPTPEQSAPAPAPEPAKKPQATFGAFSGKASPFATGTSAFGLGASSSSASPFGAAAASAGSASPFGAAAAKPAAGKGFASSGFGSYSNTNAFSSFGKKATEDDKAAGSSSAFTEILKERGEEVEEQKLQLDKQDVPTGEEEESTVFQTRVKLYALDDESGGWKERGVGALKLNKRRDGTSGARLVMRAEGVLRVILNSSLYVGMQCLQDGKHVRTSVFEGKTLRHLTIRTSNPKIATELHDAIHEHMPLESRKSASPELKLKPAAGEEQKEEDEGAGAADNV